MREVITPWMTRQKVQGDEQFRKLVETTRAQAVERRVNLERLLAEASEGMSPRTLRMIRMHVALRLPQKPMSSEEMQLWLDEHTLGVLRYMMTGKVT